jgi:hypothetical protein
MVKVKPGAKVITIATALWFFFCSNNPQNFCSTIEPLADALSVCALREVQRLGINPFVQQIEPAKDAMRMEEVVTLFSAPFARVCALKVVDKLAVNGLTHELTAAEITGFSRDKH